VISSLGSGGAALFPFITGQIAGRYGILIMPISCAVMSVLMLILWAFIPSDKPFFGACK
jgi:fucose permease